MPAPAAIRSRSAKTLLVLGVGVGLLACGACGRRGALERPTGTATDQGATAPPASARTLPGGVGLNNGTAPPDPDAVRAGDELAVVATPAGTDVSAPVQTERGSRRGFRVPKQPFFLDPIL